MQSRCCYTERPPSATFTCVTVRRAGEANAERATESLLCLEARCSSRWVTRISYCFLCFLFSPTFPALAPQQPEANDPRSPERPAARGHR